VQRQARPLPKSSGGGRAVTVSFFVVVDRHGTAHHFFRDTDEGRLEERHASDDPVVLEIPFDGILSRDSFFACMD
jgi:hypothetical protein